MLENCQSARERWGGVNEIIDRWLEGRQRMLVQYCDLCELTDDEDSRTNTDTCEVKLQSLCQILVDYISAGHFEIYEQLVKEGQEFDDKKGLKEATGAYKIIDPTTEHLLDFNDKYQETDDLESLSSDLSILGENLASRFEAEDKMIEVLHVAHQDQLVG